MTTTQFDRKALRDLLEEKGIIRADFANECGIGPDHLNHVLAGSRTPGGTLVKLMARLLGVDESALAQTEEKTPA